MGPADGNVPIVPLGPAGFVREFAGLTSAAPPVLVPGIAPVAPANGAPDLVTQARSRVITQYRAAVKLLAAIDAIIYLFQATSNAAAGIPAFDDIDQAGGVNLDATAELVGQTRVLPGYVTISDDNLRILTRLRIIRNQSTGTAPEIINAMVSLFGNDGTHFNYASRGAMFAEIQSQRQPTALEIAAVQDDLLPRPMGVDLVASWYTPARHFGWSSDATAVGFGELSDPTKGGCFGEIFSV